MINGKKIEFIADDPVAQSQNFLKFPHLDDMLYSMKQIKVRGGDCFVMEKIFHDSIINQLGLTLDKGASPLIRILEVPVYVEDTPELVAVMCTKLLASGNKPVPVLLGKKHEPRK